MTVLHSQLLSSAPLHTQATKTTGCLGFDYIPNVCCKFDRNIKTGSSFLKTVFSSFFGFFFCLVKSGFTFIRLQTSEWQQKHSDWEWSRRSACWVVYFVCCRRWKKSRGKREEKQVQILHLKQFYVLRKTKELFCCCKSFTAKKGARWFCR